MSKFEMEWVTKQQFGLHLWYTQFVSQHSYTQLGIGRIYVDFQVGELDPLLQESYGELVQTCCSLNDL
eukprot:snap_masked-scaffold_7-processed-gene-8.28-mRNA-1 protein AED:1.00 eAED:1.00 QI:0/0/0/0/1/1/2/0/67